MKKNHFTYTLVLFCSIFIFSCEKEITVDLQDSEPKLVVDGSIREDLPPIVLLTKSQNYFSSTNINDLADLFVNGAIVSVSNGIVNDTLIEICAATLTPTELETVSELLGVNPEVLVSLNYCAYTSLNSAIFGEVGKTYNLTISSEGKTYTGSTSILNPIPLDSAWFKPAPGEDSLGWVWTTLSDPATTGDNYRIGLQRINAYSSGENMGEQKDPYIIYDNFSVFDDKFFNGLTFEFYTERGAEDNSSKPDDNNEEAYLFKVGDTIVVEFSTLDKSTFEFIRLMEAQIDANGNPFASPADIPSNISNGALGSWAGYSSYYDTIVAN